MRTLFHISILSVKTDKKLGKNQEKPILHLLPNKVGDKRTCFLDLEFDVTKEFIDGTIVDEQGFVDQFTSSFVVVVYKGLPYS